ncbi:MAG: hypothetical protein KAT46_07485, partial [Deltaproteobacteria bacterium]|nr:hypothetical protein [Deltaproteobacteria bacterium]
DTSDSGEKLLKKYLELLKPGAKKNFEELKKYFNKKGKKCLIKWVRNKYAFHNDKEQITKQITKQIKDVLDEHVFQWYLTEVHGNSFYFMSEEISAMVIAKDVGGEDLGASLDIFHEEVVSISGKLQKVIAGCMNVIRKKYIEGGLEKIEIPAPLNLKDVFIPYFTKLSSKKKVL